MVVNDGKWGWGPWGEVVRFPNHLNAEEDDEDDTEAPTELHEANGWWKKPSKAWTSRILTECNIIFQREMMKDDLLNGSWT